ncbi:hypothetical protein LZ31DRAFT_91735 [Colletotrichum somersetense]|nr:hypothetical protein LZ31DRAFT_91735 [Colletotrichum somersetense]
MAVPAKGQLTCQPHEDSIELCHQGRRKPCALSHRMMTGPAALLATARDKYIRRLQLASFITIHLPDYHVHIQSSTKRSSTNLFNMKFSLFTLAAIFGALAATAPTATSAECHCEMINGKPFCPGLVCASINSKPLSIFGGKRLS